MITRNLAQQYFVKLYTHTASCIEAGDLSPNSTRQINECVHIYSIIISFTDHMRTDYIRVESITVDFDPIAEWIKDWKTPNNNLVPRYVVVIKNIEIQLQIISPKHSEHGKLIKLRKYKKSAPNLYELAKLLKQSWKEATELLIYI